MNSHLSTCLDKLWLELNRLSRDIEAMNPHLNAARREFCNVKNEIERIDRYADPKS